MVKKEVINTEYICGQHDVLEEYDYMDIEDRISKWKHVYNGMGVNSITFENYQNGLSSDVWR